MLGQASSLDCHNSNCVTCRLASWVPSGGATTRHGNTLMLMLPALNLLFSPVNPQSSLQGAGALQGVLLKELGQNVLAGCSSHQVNMLRH